MCRFLNYSMIFFVFIKINQCLLTNSQNKLIDWFRFGQHLKSHENGPFQSTLSMCVIKDERKYFPCLIHWKSHFHVEKCFVIITKKMKTSVDSWCCCWITFLIVYIHPKTVIFWQIFPIKPPKSEKEVVLRLLNLKLFNIKWINITISVGWENSLIKVRMSVLDGGTTRRMSRSPNESLHVAEVSTIFD